MSTNETGPITFELRTTRHFKDLNEFKDYCSCMSEQRLFVPEFWEKLILFKEYTYATIDPANNSPVVSKGEWSFKPTKS